LLIFFIILAILGIVAFSAINFRGLLNLKNSIRTTYTATRLRSGGVLPPIGAIKAKSKLHLSRSEFVDLLYQTFAHRHLPSVLAIIAIVTMVPTLGLGRIGDDIVHRAWLIQPADQNKRLLNAGLIPPGSSQLSFTLMNLYSFSGPQTDLEKITDTGFAPWWTSGETILSFWRPLAALTHWVDYRLWPNSPTFMHLHSLLWFGAAIFMVTLLYRRLLTTAWIAGLAALLYLLDNNYFYAVAWIANRNAIISLFFGILTLIFHDRWRRQGSAVSAVLSPLFFTLSVLSAEAGIATAAYLVAYAMILDRGKVTRRALSLLPALCVAGVWRIVYSFLGYGVYNSGLYIDPIREPLQFAAAVLERTPFLLLGQLGFPPVDTFSILSDPALKLMWFTALAFLTLVLIILLPLLLKDRVAGFWGIGMLLAVVPVCTVSMLSGRHLLFVGLGAMGLLGEFIGGLFAKNERVPHSRNWRIPAWSLCLILLVLHIGAAGLGRTLAPIILSQVNHTRESYLQVGMEPELEDQDLIIVNSPSPYLFMYFPFFRAEQGAPIPRATRILVPAFVPLEVIRAEDNALIVTTLSSNLLSLEPPTQEIPWNIAFSLWRLNDTFSTKDFSNQNNNRIQLSNLTIGISRFGEEGLPKEVAFRFNVPLEDPSLKFLMWDWQTGSYVPFKLPPVGGTVHIAGPFQAPAELLFSDLLNR
jgi:hypothetical protein